MTDDELIEWVSDVFVELRDMRVRLEQIQGELVELVVAARVPSKPVRADREEQG